MQFGSWIYLLNFRFNKKQNSFIWYRLASTGNLKFDAIKKEIVICFSTETIYY